MDWPSLFLPYFKGIAMDNVEGDKTEWGPVTWLGADTGYDMRVNIRPCDEACQCGKQDADFPNHIWEFRLREPSAHSAL